jgi:hypothetical protein
MASWGRLGKVLWSGKQHCVWEMKHRGGRHVSLEVKAGGRETEDEAGKKGNELVHTKHLEHTVIAQ